MSINKVDKQGANSGARRGCRSYVFIWIAWLACQHLALTLSFSFFVCFCFIQDFKLKLFSCLYDSKLAALTPGMAWGAEVQTWQCPTLWPPEGPLINRVLSKRQRVVIVEGTLVQQSVPRLRGPDCKKCNFLCLAEHGRVVIAPPGWLLRTISAIQMSCAMAVCELQAITINGR